MKKKIRFLQPTATMDRVFNIGDVAEWDAKEAAVFIQRGVAEEVKPEARTGAKEQA